MRDYQTKRERAIPNDVWRMTIDIIRGYYRRKENLKDLVDETPDKCAHSSGGIPGSPVETKAIKRERDRDIVVAIDKALNEVPEEYRHGVWQKVLYNAPYPHDADKTTYSRHKSEFVLRVAFYLGLS